MSQAGRNLDVRIATEVMGYVCCTNERHNDPDSYPNTYCFARPESPTQGGEVPEYSKYIAAAWDVVNALLKRGFILQLDVCGEWGNDVKISRRGGGEASYVKRPGDTVPEAICYAALACIAAHHVRDTEEGQ